MKTFSRTEDINALRSKGLRCLFHVTDESNLESIISESCICSWAGRETMGINVPCPGGDAITHALDKRAGLDRYVHLYLREPDEATLERFRISGRMKNPVVLRIAPDAVSDNTVFSIGDTYGKGSQTCDLKTILDYDEIPPTAQAHIQNVVAYRYIENIPKEYFYKVSNQHPTALVFIIDHSESMSRSAEIAGRKYDYMSDAVASIVNSQIQKLLERCTENGNVSDLFHIAVIGYGKEAYSAWSGRLKGRGFVPMSEIALSKGDDEFPWIEPCDDGGGSHCELAMQRAYELLHQWMQDQYSTHFFPPTVIHITDGDVNDHGREFIQYAEKIKGLRTSDGNVLVWNLNISPNRRSEFLLPTGADLYAIVNCGLLLYEASSVLPEAFNKEIAAIKGDCDDLPHRALGVNVSLDTMSKLIDLSTSSLYK